MNQSCLPRSKAVLREEALRRALQFGRDRRARELEEVQERSRVLRRRLRELTDRGLALGSVHGRFGMEGAGSAAAPEPAAVQHPTMGAAPVPRPPTLAPSFTLAPLAPRPEESHAKLLGALAARLERARVLELAGSRPGPAGPIRVFRVPRAAAPPEVR